MNAKKVCFVNVLNYILANGLVIENRYAINFILNTSVSAYFILFIILKNLSLYIHHALQT
jgi:hypothetical protein